MQMTDMHRFLFYSSADVVRAANGRPVQRGGLAEAFGG